MIGRRTAVGLSLLCALVFCAVAAQGASAAKGTTTYTCAPSGEGAKQFQDAHCDTVYSSGSGFRHVAIVGSTEVEGSNEKTAGSTLESTKAVLVGTLGGIKVSIHCNKVTSTGSFTNEEIPPMRAKGPATITYSVCTVTEPAGCTVAQPIVAEANGVTISNVGEMGIEFVGSKAAQTFVEIKIENCGALNGTYPVKGAVIGTPGNAPEGKGATLYFNKEAGMQKLTLGGKAAEYTGVETVRMKGAGNAIVLTTSEP